MLVVRMVNAQIANEAAKDMLTRANNRTVAIRKNGEFLQVPMLGSHMRENKDLKKLFAAVTDILGKLDDKRQTRLNCQDPLGIAIEGEKFVIAVTNGMPADQYGSRHYDRKLLEFSLIAEGMVEVKQNGTTHTYALDEIAAAANEISKRVPENL